MDVYDETVIDHVNGMPLCGISSGDRKVKNRLAKLAEQYPEQCVPQTINADGGVYYHVPWEWIVIRPPIKRKFTEEQKQMRRERLAASRNPI